MFDDIQKKYIEARRSQDKFVTSVLNMVISDLKYEKINKQKELEDTDVLTYLQKSIKTKKDAIVEYQKANRTDLIEKDTSEMQYLLKLLPQMMSESEIRDIVIQAKADTGASTPADMGKLMKEVIQRCKGLAEGSVVKNIVVDVLKG